MHEKELALLKTLMFQILLLMHIFLSVTLLQLLAYCIFLARNIMHFNSLSYIFIELNNFLIEPIFTMSLKELGSFYSYFIETDTEMLSNLLLQNNLC